MSENQSTVTPRYLFNISTDPQTGLRSALLDVFYGWPSQYRGKWVMRELTFGEKIDVESKIPLNEKGEMDAARIGILTTLATIRSSPIKLGEEEMRLMPGRVGTLLINFAAALNNVPDAEKNV